MHHFFISSKLSSIAFSLNTHCDHFQDLAWHMFQLQMLQLHSVNTDCHVSGKMGLFTLGFFNSMMCEKLFGAWWGGGVGFRCMFLSLVPASAFFVLFGTATFYIFRVLIPLILWLIWDRAFLVPVS